MEDLVLKNITDYNLIEKGQIIGVGFSGGSDSVVLLHCLNVLSKKIGFKIVAIHINHGIRGQEAERDQAFAEEFCKKYGIEIIVKRVDAINFSKQNKFTLEQGARILRYSTFEEVAKSRNINKIALAHHALDQAETILMHIGRGSGLRGLVGMRFSSGIYIRPLLDISKAQIMDYINKNNLQFVEDSTNNCTDYARNFVRHKVIEDLKSVYPSAVENIVKLSKRVQEELDCVDGFVDDEWFRMQQNGVVLKGEAFCNKTFLINQAIFKALDLLNAVVDVEEKHLVSVRELFKRQVGKSINLPNGVVVVKTYDGLLFSKITDVDYSQETELFGVGNIKFLGRHIHCEVVQQSDVNFKPKELYLDYGKLPSRLIWRTPKEGDFIVKFGGQTRKLKQYLTDKKIGAIDRKSLPCLMSGAECFAIFGVEISDKVKLDENTIEVLKIW